MASKNGVRNRVRIDDVGSILKFRIGFPFGENSARFCRSVWLLGSILNFRIGSVPSIGGLIAATLFSATISDSQRLVAETIKVRSVILAVQTVFGGRDLYQ